MPLSGTPNTSIAVQVSYAFASAFDEAAAGSGKGTKRPLAEEGGEPEGAAKRSPAKGKGKGGLLERKSPVSLAKAVKNEAELAGMREAHLRDAEAICDFLAWIEKEVCARTVRRRILIRLLCLSRAARHGACCLLPECLLQYEGARGLS